MDEILNNRTQEISPDNNAIPLPRVPIVPPLPRVPVLPTAPPPRVPVPLTEETTVCDMPSESVINKKSLVSTNPRSSKMNTRSSARASRPTTRSRYNQALEDIVRRQQGTGQRLTRDGAEMLQMMVEMACDIFDEETGKHLKYRQLINHPKYREIWMHSSANKFGHLAQGAGG